MITQTKGAEMKEKHTPQNRWGGAANHAKVNAITKAHSESGGGDENTNAGPLNGESQTITPKRGGQTEPLFGINPGRLALMEGVGPVERNKRPYGVAFSPRISARKNDQPKHPAVPPAGPPLHTTGSREAGSEPGSEGGLLASGNPSTKGTKTRVTKQKKSGTAKKKKVIGKKEVIGKEQHCEKELKRTFRRIEREESKRLAVEINTHERKAALECCALLGFTLENTAGVDDINPAAADSDASRSAVERALINKELLVREKALAYCRAHDFNTPPALLTPHERVDINGRRVLMDGTLETDEEAQTRLRLDLAEYNQMGKELRRQARRVAMEAGLRKGAELTA
ncbi:MAG: hypothetical protein M1832_000373 [Thelocarpon impressellum]|nr:MAG: hypothetical protein M1832_000373 [Thelocarpon impressellum]